MTIPMLPGFWDENKEAIQSLAQTITRSINPYFDNQVALMQGIRQNPGNLQGIIDMSALNPDMFAQTFGPRMLQQLASMGNPSSQAIIEGGAREALNTNTPIANVAPTVKGDAVAKAVGSRTATDLRREETAANIAETSLEAMVKDEEQKELMRNLENPSIKAKYEALNEDIKKNAPTIAVFRPQERAQQYLKGELNYDEFAGELKTLAEMNPAVLDAFWKYVDILSGQQRDALVDARIRERMDKDFERTQDAQLRDARRLAWQTFREYKIPYELMVKHYMGENVPLVEELMGDNTQLKEDQRRLKLMGELMDITAAYTKATGANKEIMKDNLEMAINQIVPGVKIEKVSMNWYSKTSKYTYNGEAIDGDELSDLLRHPRSFQSAQAARERLNAMSVEELRKAIADADAMKQLGELTDQEYTNEKSRLDQALKKKLAEEEKEKRSEAQRR